MILVQDGCFCDYEMNIFMRLFFENDADVQVFTNLEERGGGFFAYCQINYRGAAYFGEFVFGADLVRSDANPDRLKSIAVTRAFVTAAGRIKPEIGLPWGVMCGVRPAKIVTKLKDFCGMTALEARAYIERVYGATPEKCDLAVRVSENERAILKGIKKRSVSLYIGIPFCPTRCLYCSFISSDMRITAKYIDDFVTKLCVELEKTAEIVKNLSLSVENIYIGGGTPTSLSEIQLGTLLNKIKSLFYVTKLKEFTLEAGRPDTITREKLGLARACGVGRISINPQTTCDETLARIGRRHSTAMFFDAYKTAREVGFDVINCDLIAGLPGERAEIFRKSIDEVAALEPENVTIHSMCVKRAARFAKENSRLAEYAVMNEMLSYAQKSLSARGYEPYYMYRQKNISGNLENVGYSLPGAFSFYNVNIMEEAQTIIAMGGGATTKLVCRDGGISRIFNFKDPAEYIKNFDEILRRKEETARIIAEKCL